MAEDAKHEGLPVAGYRPQTDKAVALVNINKLMEEALLQHLDLLKEAKDIEVDPRWLATGRTDIEKGFMAVNRAIFRPARLSAQDLAEGTAAVQAVAAEAMAQAKGGEA